MGLERYGWSSYLRKQRLTVETPGIGRVSLASHGFYTVQTTGGARPCEVAGSRDDCVPVVGDWVRLDSNNRIMEVLPRAGVIRRKRPGRRAESQVLAANVDAALIVCGLDGDFNLRRIERYLVVAREGGVRPVIVLNKADLSASPWGAQARVERIAGRAPVCLTAARDGTGIEDVTAELGAGETAVLLGSSGAGKSTIVNRLLETERQRMGSVREQDSRGRHTTTHRELLVAPCGWILIDTPGLRELQAWAPGEAIQRTFEDIDSLAAHCRFRDCAHQGEPGCAVAVAVEAGEIDEGRMESFHRLSREAHQLAARVDLTEALCKKARDKRLHKMIRRMPNKRDR